MMYIMLSWRNLWRNRKRTLIAAASVFFAVLLAVVMRSAQEGSYSYMISSSVKMHTGYMQVQKKGYWDDRSLDKSIVIDEARQRKISHIDHITSIVPRLEAFSLVSFGKKTRVAEVIGIDPAAENSMTELKKKLVQGIYLGGGGDGVLVAQGLADILKVGIGGRLVLYGQGFHGQIAAALLPVTGIVKFPISEMNNSMVYLPLSSAQNIFSASGRITSLAVMIDDKANQEKVQKSLWSLLDKNMTIMTWQEMLPELVQGIQMDNISGLVMLIILYIIIAFGIFGTIMMMTSERAREFGVLISVGMKKNRLIWVTTLETIFLSFLGAVFGALAGLPIISYLHNHPIPITGSAARAFDSMGLEPLFNFSAALHIFTIQGGVVLAIALTTVLYPLLFIGRLKPVDAMRD